MGRNQCLRDRVSAAIIDAAAIVLSERGDGAGMGEVAGRAGVSRATLYRYFPRREDLLVALVEVAVDDAHRRLVEAALASVSTPEAIARMARALVGSGVRYSLLLVEGARAHIDHDEVERQLGAIIRAVFVRGVETGSLRGDLPIETLVMMFGGLLKVGTQMAIEQGVEQASAAIATVLLDGVAASVSS